MVFLSGLLPASCHKSSPKPAATASVVVAGATNSPSAKTFNGKLGELTLTNHSDTCLLFGNGENFTLSPKVLDRNRVQITLTLESKNKYGETKNYSVTQVVAQPGKPLEVALGDMNLSFTPQIVDN